MFKKIILLALVLLLGISFPLYAEKTTLVTHYPSPYGNFYKLTLSPTDLSALTCDASQLGAIWNDEVTGSLKFCTDSGYTTPKWSYIPGVWVQAENTLDNNRPIVFLADPEPDLFVGLGTDDPDLKLTLSGDGGILAMGTFGQGVDVSTSGAGTRMIWHPKKAAFRAGRVANTEWNNANIGDYSIAMGYKSKASGESSIALGNGASAAAANALVLGGENNAISETTATHAVVIGGVSNTASGKNSVAFGDNVSANSYNAFVIGRKNYIPTSAYDKENWVAEDPLFVIGNGDDSSVNNALTVTKNAKLSINDPTPNAYVDIGPDINTAGTFDFLEISSWDQQAFDYTDVQPGGDIFNVRSNGRVGIGVINPEEQLHVENGNVKIETGNLLVDNGNARVNNGSLLMNGTTGATPIEGEGTRLMWIPAKYAFRAGRVADMGSSVPEIPAASPPATLIPSFANSWDAANIGNYSTIAGGWNNIAYGEYSAILGGQQNQIEGYQGTIGGGRENRIVMRDLNIDLDLDWNSHRAGSWSFIGGGDRNKTIHSFATVGGGIGNNAKGFGSVIAGGIGNETGVDAPTKSTVPPDWIYPGERSTVGGGSGNKAKGSASTIPGGYGNEAIGIGSVAMGAFTIARAAWMTAVGTKNFDDANYHPLADNGEPGSYYLNEPVFVVGNGVCAQPWICNGERRNALTILKSGKTVIATSTVAANLTAVPFADGNPGGTIYALSVRGGDIGVDAGRGLYQPSDRRLKKNVEPIGKTLEKILHVSGVTYHTLNEDDTATKHYGFIAQDMEAQFPGLVRTNVEGYKSLDYSLFTTVLWEAVKELKEENDQLKKNLEDHQKRIELLEQRIK